MTEQRKTSRRQCERATRDGDPAPLGLGRTEGLDRADVDGPRNGGQGGGSSLIDKVHPVRTLDAAFHQVAANKGAAGWIT